MQIDEIEALLTRELHDIAGGVDVPARPTAPSEETSPGRRWLLPVVVAAAVLLILGGVTALLTHGDRSPGPTDHGIPTGAPAVPFVIGESLHVAGEVVPGRWAAVVSAGDAWVAARRGSGWWWGTGTNTHHADLAPDSMPVLSRDGAVIALPQTAGGKRVDVRATATGKLLGTWKLKGQPDLTSTGIQVSAVTDSPVSLILAGVDGQKLWSLSTGRITMLPQGHTVMMDTPGGMLISDLDLNFNLGSIDENGAVHLGAAVPRKLVTHGAAFDAYSGQGWIATGQDSHRVRTADGDGTAGYASLEARKLGGKERVVLHLPDGWLAVNIVWESSDRLIADAAPVRTGKVSASDYRLVRCVVSLQRCAVVDGR